MSFVSKNPKLAFLLVGFLFGGILAFVVSKSGKDTASIYREQIAKLETELARSEYDYQQVSNKNKELSKRLKEEYTEIIRPDGTKEIRRKTDSSEDSREQEITTIRIKYEEEIARLKAEYRKVEVVNNKMGFGVGYDWKGAYGPVVSYDLHPNFNIGAGAFVNDYKVDNLFIFAQIQF
jgi:hypothetical protein